MRRGKEPVPTIRVRQARADQQARHRQIDPTTRGRIQPDPSLRHGMASAMTPRIKRLVGPLGMNLMLTEPMRRQVNLTVLA